MSIVYWDTDLDFFGPYALAIHARADVNIDANRLVVNATPLAATAHVSVTTEAGLVTVDTTPLAPFIAEDDIYVNPVVIDQIVYWDDSQDSIGYGPQQIFVISSGSPAIPTAGLITVNVNALEAEGKGAALVEPGLITVEVYAQVTDVAIGYTQVVGLPEVDVTPLAPTIKGAGLVQPGLPNLEVKAFPVTVVGAAAPTAGLIEIDVTPLGAGVISDVATPGYLTLSVVALHPKVIELDNTPDWMYRDRFGIFHPVFTS